MNLLSLKLERRIKAVIFFVGLMAGVLFFFFALYLPQREQIAALQLACAAGKAQISQVENFMNLHHDLLLYVQEVQKKQVLADKKLPENLAFSAFITQIEQEAEKSQLVLLQMKPEQKKVKHDFVEIPIQLEVRGGYFKIVDFLQKVEQLERFNTVHDLDIKAKDGSLDCKMNLHIYAYGIF